LIVKDDAYLSVWLVVLLLAGSRLILINSILDTLPTYSMAAMVLPPLVMKSPQRVVSRVSLGCS
jgi:hypothetical protein